MHIIDPFIKLSDTRPAVIYLQSALTEIYLIWPTDDPGRPKPGVVQKAIEGLHTEHDKLYFVKVTGTVVHIISHLNQLDVDKGLGGRKDRSCAECLRRNLLSAEVGC